MEGLRGAAPTAAIATLLLLPVLLAGCGHNDGGGGGTTATTTTLGPCPPSLTRGHCTSQCAFYDNNVAKCLQCASGWTFNPNPATPDEFCTFDCSKFKPDGKPPKPDRADQHNGVTWPGVCIDESVSKFFTIGDWGGVCKWRAPGVENICDPGQKPFPQNNRPKGIPLHPYDHIAQELVSKVMLKRQKQLKAQNMSAKYIINVGDNFYPGGIDVHCGKEAEAMLTQFDQIWKKMYPEDLEELEWWSVLGNHDYGGVCYIKGWDQQIYYTWKDDKWVMPGQYWKRSVQYKTFTVDFFFIDGNQFDGKTGTKPTHWLCNPSSNPGLHCETDFYPPPKNGSGGTCSPTGPTASGACEGWFDNLWSECKDWLEKEVKASTADWQIVVNHYPPNHNLGGGASFMNWKEWLTPNGIDLYISGHTHEQLLGDPKDEEYQKTGWLITGGGGGITAESLPADNGEDNAYGFMEVTISLQELQITAWSHGGSESKLIVRKNVTVEPVTASQPSDEELKKLGIWAPHVEVV